MMESGGGQIRDRGAHVMSCAMWWMDADDTGPVTVEATGTLLFSEWVLPFEVTSLLLIIASVGAVGLALFRPRKGGE